MNKYIFVLFIILAIGFQNLSSQTDHAGTVRGYADTVIVFVPFVEESGFGGRWDLKIDLPRYLASYCRQRLHITTVPPQEVDIYCQEHGISAVGLAQRSELTTIAKKFSGRYIITGSIREFSVGRFLIGEQILAGYEAFSAVVLVHFTIHDALQLESSRDDLPLYDGEAAGVVKDRALGITLFGKPTERMNQYFSLDNLYFGGEQFNKTVIGEAMLKCAVDFSAKVAIAVPFLRESPEEYIQPPKLDSLSSDTTFTLRRKVVTGEIVFVDKNEVFINLGTEDGIKEGERLPVFTKGTELRDPKTNQILGETDKRIGEITILEMRGPHLSLGTVLTKSEEIKVKDKVRKIVVQ